MMEARIWTFETVAMYTIAVLLTLPAPGAARLCWLQPCWGRGTGLWGLHRLSSDREPQLQSGCAAMLRRAGRRTRAARGAAASPSLSHRTHVAQGSSKGAFTSLLPSNSPHLSKGKQVNSWQQLIVLKAHSQKIMDWIYSATAAIRHWHPTPGKITWKIISKWEPNGH